MLMTTTHTPRNADSPLRRAKARLDIPALWRRLDLPGQPRRSCRSPFREDRTPSFAITADGQRWRDFATGESGDAVDFLTRARHLSRSEGARQFITLAGLGDNSLPPSPSAAGPARASDESIRKARRAAWPLLTPPTTQDIARIAELRGLSPEGVSLAADRGLLWMAESREGPAWVITDARRRNAQGRLISGQPWAAGMKARTLPGSEAAWPIGLREAAEYPLIAWCEGGPDLLAACHLAWCHGLEHQMAPVTMLGAGQAIPPHALTDGSLRGRRIRIYGHEDEAGRLAAQRWGLQLYEAGALVDGYSPAGLRRHDGGPVTDLNDLAHIDPDTWESNRATLDAAFTFPPDASH